MPQVPVLAVDTERFNPVDQPQDFERFVARLARFTGPREGWGDAVPYTRARFAPRPDPAPPTLRRIRNMLFGKLLPREGNFFELFNQHGEPHRRGRARLHATDRSNYADPELREQYTAEVDDAERAGRPLTAEVNRLLHKTFITPIDREQIHGLINAMDDVLDLLQDATETMSLYDVRAMTEDIAAPGRPQRASAASACSTRSTLLPQDQPSRDVAEAALKTCEEIDRLESDADRVMRSAMCKLFREEQDVRELIKLQGDLRAAGVDHRPLRGRRQPDRGHRPRELLSAPAADGNGPDRASGSSRCWSLLAHRVRLHERLPRRGELDRHRGLDRRAQAAAGGGCSPPSSTSSRSSSST